MTRVVDISPRLPVHTPHLPRRYPFESPVIRVLEGLEVIPTALLSGDVVVLPDSDSWTPSNTIIATLQVFKR